MGSDGLAPGSVSTLPSKYYLTNDPAQDKEAIREAVSYKLKNFNSQQQDLESFHSIMKVKKSSNSTNSSEEESDSETPAHGKLNRCNSLPLMDMPSYVEKYHQTRLGLLDSAKSKGNSTAYRSETEAESPSLDYQNEQHGDSKRGSDSEKQGREKLTKFNGVTIIVSDEHCNDITPDTYCSRRRGSKNELHPNFGARNRRRSLTISESLLSGNHHKKKRKSSESGRKEDGKLSHGKTKSRLSKILMARLDLNNKTNQDAKDTGTPCFSPTDSVFTSPEPGTPGDDASIASIRNQLRNTYSELLKNRTEKEGLYKKVNSMSGEIDSLNAKVQELLKESENQDDHHKLAIKSIQNQYEQHSYKERLKFQDEVQTFKERNESQREEINHLKELLLTAHQQLESCCFLKANNRHFNCVSPPRPKEENTKSYKGRRRRIIHKTVAKENQAFPVVQLQPIQGRSVEINGLSNHTLNPLAPSKPVSERDSPLIKLEGNNNKVNNETLKDLKERIIDIINRLDCIGDAENKLVVYTETIGKVTMAQEELFKKLQRDLEKCLGDEQLNFLAPSLSETIVTLKESNDENERLKTELGGIHEVVSTLKAQLNTALGDGGNNSEAIRNLEYEKAELTTQLDIKMKELNVLAEEVDNARTELEQSRASAESMRDEVNACKDTIELLQTKLSSQDEKREVEAESMKRELKELRSKLANEISRNDELKTTLDKTQTQLNNGDKEIREYQEMISDHKNDLEAANNRCHDISNERDRLNEELAKSIANANTLKVDLEREQNNSEMLQGIVDSLKSEKSDSEVNKSSTEGELAVVKKALDQEKELSKDLSKQIESLQIDLGERNREVDGLKEKEETLQREVGFSKSSLENEKKNAADKLTELTILRAELEEHEQLVKMNSTTKDQLSCEVYALQEDIQHWKDLVEKTSSEKDRLQVELSKSQREFLDMDNDCKQLRENLEDLQSKVKADKEIISSLDSQNKLLQAKLDVNEKANDNMTGRIKDSQSNSVIKLLEDQVKHLTEDIGKWKAKFDEVSDEADRLQRKLESEKEMTEKERRQTHREREEKEELMKECEVLHQRLREQDHEMLCHTQSRSLSSEKELSHDKEDIKDVNESKDRSVVSEKRTNFIAEEYEMEFSRLKQKVRKLEKDIDDKSVRAHEIDEENASLRKRLRIAMRDIEDSLAISSMLEKSLEFDRRSFSSREAMVNEQYIQQRESANLLAAQLAEAQSEIAFLEQKNTWLTEEIERERASVNLFKAQNIQSTSDQITSLRELVYKLRAENEQLHGEKLSITKQLSNAKNEMNNLRRETNSDGASQKREFSLLENQLKDARREIKSLKDRLNLKERDYERYHDHLIAAENSFKTTSASLGEELSAHTELQRRNNELEDDLRASKEKITKLREKVTFLEAENLQLDAKFKRLQQRHDSVEQALSNERASALSAIKAVKSESERHVSELISQSNGYKQQVIELNKKLCSIEHKLKSVTENRDQLKDEITSMERVVDTYRLKAKEESEECLVNKQKSQQLSLAIEKLQQLQVDQSKESARLQASLTCNESILIKEKERSSELEQELLNLKSACDYHKKRAETFEEQARDLNAKLVELHTAVNLKNLQDVHSNPSELTPLKLGETAEDVPEIKVAEDDKTNHQSINNSLDRALETHNKISNRTSGLERDVARLKLALSNINMSDISSNKMEGSTTVNFSKSEEDDGVVVDGSSQSLHPSFLGSGKIMSYGNFKNGDTLDFGSRRLRTRSAQSMETSDYSKDALFGSHQTPTLHYRSPTSSELQSDPNRLRQLLFKKSLLESHPAYSVLTRPTPSA